MVIEIDLGAGPCLGVENWWCFGWMNDSTWSENCGWAEAHWGQWKDCNEPGFCHSLSAFHDRISGIQDGDHYKNDDPNVELLWSEAANIVQWQHPNSNKS